MTFQWLGADPHDLKEQVLDAAGVACAALEDAKRGDVAGSLEDAEAQLAIAREALQALQREPAPSEFVTEAQDAVLRAERCTAEIRAIVSPSKRSSPWGWIALGVGIGIVAIAWGSQ